MLNMSNEGQLDHEFEESEELFHRIHPESWQDYPPSIGIDAIRVPDTSVNRDKYNGLTECLLGFDGWGAVKFQVGKVPVGHWDNGALVYTYRTMHDPQPSRFSHCEIRAFDTSNSRVSKDDFDEIASLKLRYRLVRELKTARPADINAWSQASTQ